MFRAPEARLILHVHDPLMGDQVLPLAGPLETDRDWEVAAIERVKAAG
jgi:hypothetical protein